MKKLFCLIFLFFLTGCTTVVTSNVEFHDSLRHAYEDYFDIGVAITSRNMNDLISEDLLKEYSTITCEYEMKWNILVNENKEYDFTALDSIYDFCKENDKTMRGHTLVWRDNVPKFIYDIVDSNKSTDLKIEEVLSYLKEFYTHMISKYGDVLEVYDIVNEVIEDSNPYLYRHDNIYFKLCNYDDTLFESFIASVFKMANEVAPDVTMYYNDYFILTDPIKRDKVLTFINRINALGANCKGVGMQSHINTSITKEQVDDALADIRNNGLVTSFTELDISIYETDFVAPTLPVNELLLSDYDDKLSRAFNHVFASARENSDIVENVTFWGIYDKESWLVGSFYDYRTDFPLLFDENYTKKKAYYIVRDFEVVV